MSIETNCPSCQTLFRLLNDMAGKVKNNELLAADNWNTVAATLPERMRFVASDPRGGLFADTDKGEFRYYPDPFRTPSEFHAWTPPGQIRRILTPPQGGGALDLTIDRAYWVEYTGKK